MLGLALLAMTAPRQSERDPGAAQWLVLPGETYVEYQLAPQRERPDSFRPPGAKPRLLAAIRKTLGKASPVVEISDPSAHANWMNAWKKIWLAAVLGLVGLAPDAEAQALATALSKPEIRRDASGEVTITCTTLDGVIRYSIDGSDPGPNGGPYLAPISLPQGGVVKARVFTPDRKEKGELAEVEFAALPGAPKPSSSLVSVTQDRDWPIYDWAKRHAAVSALVRDRKASLVFIGDSITHMFGGEPHDLPQPGKDVWEKYYAKRNTANLGFGYDFTENVIWRIEHGQLDGAAAKVVVLLIGTNNTEKNSAPDIAAAIRAICDLIRKKQPQAKILLLGILPRSPKPDGSRAKIAEINQLISKYDGHGGITYLDAGGKFIGADGTISKELMYDFLHPTAKGYEVLAESIEPTLVRLLGESKP